MSDASIYADDFKFVALLASSQDVRIDLALEGFRLSTVGAEKPLVIRYDEFVHTLFKREIFRVAIKKLRRNSQRRTEIGAT